MPMGPPRLVGGQSYTSNHEWWNLHPAKLFIIWFCEIVFMWMLLSSDIESVLWKEPSKDWKYVASHVSSHVMRALTPFREISHVLEHELIT